MRTSDRVEMGTKIGSPMRGQKSGTSSGTFLTDGPTGGDRDNSGNKNIGAFAKEVMKLDKEPPRRSVSTRRGSSSCGAFASCILSRGSATCKFPPRWFAL